MKTLLFATGNMHKVQELRALLSDMDYKITTPSEAGLEFSVEENGTTFEENSMIKAKAGYDLTGIPSISDDSGLVIDALNGKPGIYSSRYAGEDASDADRISKVLSEMENNNDRKARFVCAISYYSSDVHFTVKGVCEGQISEIVLGDNGFGYDPIFVPDGFQLSFAQLPPDVKNSISHRGNALRKFKEYLERYEYKE